MKSSGLDEAPDYSVRAVERVVAILDLLQGSAVEVSLPEVADATGLPKSSAFRYLWTLESHRYVERSQKTGSYRLGARLLGMRPVGLEALRERALPILAHLRDQLGETINLGWLDSDAVIYLDIAESRRAVRLAVKPNDRELIHCTALGKVLAAQLSEESVDAILWRHGMPARTERTITDRDALFADLARVRRLGYALDNRENESDGRCVAVPVAGGRLRVAISLSAPASRFRMRDIEDAAKALREGASLISRTAGGLDPL